MNSELVDSYKVTIGDIKKHDLKDWDKLVEENGNAFQQSNIIKIFQENWGGEFQAKHISIRSDNKTVALVPGYLYESCPRLDYYKAKITPSLPDKILLSQDFLGWYGYPVAKDQYFLKLAIEKFNEIGFENNAITMFSGIDGRDIHLLETLNALGFHLAQIHTIMSRSINTAIEDPTVELPKRKRNRVRNHLNNAIKSGTVYREMKENEVEIISQLILRIIKENKMDEEILPEELVKELLKEKSSKVLVALDEKNEPIGAKLYLINGNIMYGWLSGHYRSKLDKYRQSHFLYEKGIKIATQQKLLEIQAGRSPYEVKLTHGYKPIPIFCAVKGVKENNQHKRAIDWVNSLEERHFSMFQNTFKQDYWINISNILKEVRK